VTLRSNPPELGSPLGRFYGGADGFDVLELRAAASLQPSPPVRARLADVARLELGPDAEHRTVRLTDQSINGRKMDMSRIDLTVERGTTEVWRVSNADGKPHNLHIHGVSFQVLSVDGGPPPLPDAWKDTVFLPMNREVELAVRFPDYADPTTPYMYHCHVLYHEDQGMMAQFVVVEPGQQAAPMGHSHDH
jgi:FtsP/CotA-like multicopper oxidase with cupredoxin domain